MNATGRQRAWLESAIRDLDHGLDASGEPAWEPGPVGGLQLIAAVDRALDELFDRSAARDHPSVGGDARTPDAGGRGLGIKLC